MRGLSSTGAAFAGASALLLSFFVACSDDEPGAGPTNGTPESGTTDAPSTIDAGSDGGTTEPGQPRRGSRLAPLYRETADGFSQLAGIVDTSLANEKCYAARATDGVLRCLPSETVYTGAGLFADAACTTRVAEDNGACAKPAFATVVITGGAGCDSKYEIHDLGAAHTGALYRNEGGGCVAATATAGRAYYVVGAERPASAFVKLTDGTETIAGGVGIEVVDGEDGSHFPQYELVDVTRSEVCEPRASADTKDRCLPSNAGSVNGFYDSNCTMPAAHVSQSCNAAPKVALFQDPALDGGVRVHALGAKRPTSDFWTKNEPSCDGPSLTSDDVYELGAEIPASTFPETSTKEVGGTRLVSNRVVAGGVTMPRWNGQRDIQLDARCGFLKASDGKTRCVPQGSSIEYGDDQCTQPLVVVFGSPTTLPKYAVETDKGCPPTYKLFPLAAEITPAPAMTYRNHTGTCVGKAVSAEAKVYAVGAEIPASTFVEVNEVIR